MTRFNGGYSGAFERYRQLDALNRFEQRGRLQVRHQAARQISLAAGLSMARTPTTDRLEIGALPFVDIGSRTTDVTGNAVFALARRTSLEAAYRFQDIHFERAESELLPAYLNGGYAHSPSLSLRQTLSSRLSAGTSYEYRRAIVGEGAAHFNVQNAMGDVRYRVLENTVVSGALGASYLQISETGVDRWGPSVKGAVEHQAGLTQLHLRYERAFVPSFSFGGMTGNQFLSLTATGPLTRGGRLTASGSASYGRTEPLVELGFPIQLNSYWFNGSVGYQVARWLRTDAFVTSTHQRSSAQGNINRLRAGFQFSTSKPVRIQ
jgi:hypothetical protein